MSQDAVLVYQYSTTVRPKLDLIDKLHATLEEGERTDVPLPRIAVVGAQSSGKSSVLERLSGVALPRDVGLCTRVPLILSIKQDSTPSTTIEYKAPGFKRFQKPVSPSRITDEILEATKKLAGDNEKIVDHPILLKVAGPELPDMTLVDLPGIVYNPVGDQPMDIGKQVNKLILKYITPPETVILCVFAADQDIQTSQALQLARCDGVDPKGERTLGLLTKVDRLEHPSILPQILLQQGKYNIRLGLGLIAVRNRGKEDQEANIDEALVGRREADWFQQNVKDVEIDKLGLKSLAHRLCALQLENLNKCLPSVREALTIKIAQLSKELEQLSLPISEEESFRIFRNETNMLRRLLRDICRTDYTSIHGKGLSKEEEEAMHVYPRVRDAFKSLACELLAAAPKVFTLAKRKEVREALKEVEGRLLPNFLPEVVFTSLMTRWFEPYKKLIDSAKEQAFDCIDDVVGKCVKFSIRPKLAPLVNDIFSDAMDTQIKTIEADVKGLIDKETGVIGTENDYYTVTLRKLQQALAKDGISEFVPDDADSNEGDETSVQEEFEASEEKDDIDQEEEEVAHVWDPAADLGLPAADVEENAARMDGLITSREWLTKKLGVSRAAARKLQDRHKSHKPEDMQVLDLQLSAFCYDKVRRKRICDHLMQCVRKDLLNKLEDDKNDDVSNALDIVSHSEVHKLLTKQGQKEEQQRLLLESQFKSYTELMEQLDAIHGGPKTEASTPEWSGWRKRKMAESPSSSKKARK